MIKCHLTSPEHTLLAAVLVLGKWTHLILLARMPVINHASQAREKGLTSQKWKAMLCTVVQIFSEHHQASHQEHSKYDGAPKPPVWLELFDSSVLEWCLALWWGGLLHVWIFDISSSADRRQFTNTINFQSESAMPTHVWPGFARLSLEHYEKSCIACEIKTAITFTGWMFVSSVKNTILVGDTPTYFSSRYSPAMSMMYKTFNNTGYNLSL